MAPKKSILDHIISKKNETKTFIKYFIQSYNLTYIFLAIHFKMGAKKYVKIRHMPHAHVVKQFSF